MSETEWGDTGPLDYQRYPEEDACPCDLCMGYGDEEPEPFFPDVDERRNGQEDRA
jgi:hypothetical protein